MKRVYTFQSPRRMILIAIPTKMMPTRTSHMRAAWYFLYGYITFGAFISHNQIERSHEWFECIRFIRSQWHLTFRTVINILLRTPFTFLPNIHKITTLRRTLINILIKRRILPKQHLLNLYPMFFFQRIQTINYIKWITLTKWW